MPDPPNIIRSPDSGEIYLLAATTSYSQAVDELGGDVERVKMMNVPVPEEYEDEFEDWWQEAGDVPLGTQYTYYWKAKSIGALGPPPAKHVTDAQWLKLMQLVGDDRTYEIHYPAKPGDPVSVKRGDSLVRVDADGGTHGQL